MSSAIYQPIGYMQMPPNFKYRALFLHGRPRHQKYDDFWRKHPPMDPTHRAKIFAPFDALAGFNDCIASKKVLYKTRRILSEEEKKKLDEVLRYLHSLTYNGKVARENRPMVTVTYFVPCADVNSDWYGKGGLYEEITGVVSRVDAEVSHSIIIEGITVSLDDVAGIDFLHRGSKTRNIE